MKGVGQTGCGLEAQLESFYRFLIQPDPYESVSLGKDAASCQGSGKNAASPCKATLVGYDDAILKARAEFLRPDSLVAVIMLTDEDDSSVDPLSIGGVGWGFMNSRFPGSSQTRTLADGTPADGTTAYLPTTACADDPAGSDCLSCGFKDTTGVLASDANCKKSAPFYASDEDSMNVRFFQMKKRFGADPQFPIKRYVDGLSQLRIPNRDSEHDSYGNYLFSKTCTNPLFAASLPSDSNNVGDLCNRPIGPRAPDQVFFAVVGGVPHQIVKANTGDDGTISPAGWEKIIGKDPEHYNYVGQDPHMIQSIGPRAGLPPAAAVGNNGTDEIHGREWDTEKRDLQYACTFELTKEKPCTIDGPSNQCASSNDCDGKKATPLCSQDDPKVQVRAKAYPTIREFQVVHGLGGQGIVASLCPEEVKDTKSENYGYRPAVRAIVDRLKNALANTCLPQALSPDEKGEVPCLLLETLEEEGDTCDAHGLSSPNAEVLKTFRDQQRQAAENAKANGVQEVVDETKLTVCEIPQIVKEKGSTCENDADAGWCYVTEFAKCKQSILLTPTAQVPGSKTYLQCINQFSASDSGAK